MKDVWIRYKNYSLKSLIYHKDGELHIEASGFEDDDVIVFSGRSRKEVIQKMSQWFSEQIEQGKARELMNRWYIHFYFQSVY
jgi:hypothetical protein